MNEHPVHVLLVVENDADYAPVRDALLHAQTKSAVCFIRERQESSATGLAAFQDTVFDIVLAELMHGTIGLESAPGLGSTFWIELPLRTAS